MSGFKTLLEEYATIAAFIEDKEAELAGVKKIRDKIKEALMAQMNQIGVTNAKSIAGHNVTLVNNSSVKVVDAEAFFDFVFERGDSDFLTKRASTEAVEAYVTVNNQLPPGLEMTQTQTMRFTKAK